MHNFDPSRRKFINGIICAISTLAIPGRILLAENKPIRLTAAPAMAKLVLDMGPSTAVWAYNEQIPGPLLRYRQGDTLSVEVENQLELPTTLHWHGLRVPIGMDGVPFLSQAPTAPGETFRYEFKLHDAGTFWYHPHIDSSEQVGRGLRGILIVDEPGPPIVDRDILWVLDDWRLDLEAQITPFDGNMRDASHNGRIGNVVTVNGNIGEEFVVYPGERIRLRLANVANSRTFALSFKGLHSWIIALDGHPVKPIVLDDDRLVLGAGQRADLIVDIDENPGNVSSIIDDAYAPNIVYELIRLVFSPEQTRSNRNLPPPDTLAANPVAEPEINTAERHQIVFEGGAMGGMQGAKVNGEFKAMSDLVELGKLWAVNGTVPGDVHHERPLLTLNLGKTYILELVNKTAFEHPIHLHGHSFRIISRNGEPIPYPPLRDTVLLAPNEQQEIAFVADNPGNWMFHCHILEHQNTGMTSVIAVVT